MYVEVFKLMYGLNRNILMYLYHYFINTVRWEFIVPKGASPHVGLIKEKEKLPVDQKQWTVVASVETTIIAQRVVLVWKETMLS